MHFINIFNFVKIKWNQQNKCYWLCFLQYADALCNGYSLYRFSVSKEMFFKRFWRPLSSSDITLKLSFLFQVSSCQKMEKTYWWGCGNTGAPAHCWREYETVWPFCRENRWELLRKIKHRLINLSAPLGGLYPWTWKQGLGQILVHPCPEQHWIIKQQKQSDVYLMTW